MRTSIPEQIRKAKEEVFEDIKKYSYTQKTTYNPLLEHIIITNKVFDKLKEKHLKQKV